MNPFDALPPDTELLDRLAARVATGAGTELDIAYRTIDSPVGTLLLAATPEGLLRVAYAGEDFDAVLTTLAHRVSPRIMSEPHRLDDAAYALDAYFAGATSGFDLPLDRSLSRGFRKVVQEHLSTIEYGSTQSYSQVAQQVGNPRAVRAVGTACSTNPLPIVVPCHRVLRADGSMGAYLGGVKAKQELLDLEASHR
ncbi:methylated-DNA--[protein]-cysteine S-methyltransferase [Yimella sp. cx-51]|uniref:methylated-DNA--[protein]-cysteine S-methyltransferase n=1 Tax=Yimella sp. cx-51 TaxID=2770551 RepID=UPI00165E18D8|nr:methylated-DNA--[protein]-cysteine S-methyltransferase [Yimella sp. cx-51]MBC9955520.1 methylated-DNA--[protein]-cysteine S-methyltransferase [Yimella sp. cx-51]MBD2759475.1 methylated-DNA--[protein]-cysteine S-methyltransferase [Yimella sp. cx-573]QTH37895.1 methylated-DNA--[protein]-cysteine S-methyltransferase [Yimella sp. cx-51]